MKEMEKGFPGTDFPGRGADEPSPTWDDTEHSIVLALWDCRLEPGNWTLILKMLLVNSQIEPLPLVETGFSSSFRNDSIFCCLIGRIQT